MELKPEIKIEEYPEEVTIEAGWSRNPSIVVRNVGEKKLTNVKLMIIGIPSSWISVTPKKVDELDVNETATFTVKITVPPNVDAKEFLSSFFVITDEGAKDEKQFKMLVFRSREELIAYEIKRLESELEDFKLDVRQAKVMGKDVSKVEKMIGEIEEQIDIAKKNLEEKRYDDAIAAVYTGWNLLRKARRLLAQAPFLVPVISIVIPWWMWALIFILLAVIALLLVFSKRIKRRLEMTLRHIRLPEARKIASMIAVETKEMVEEKEKERIRRTLALLEKEYRYGIISRSTYEELKKRNEERLKKLEEKSK